MPSHRPAFPKAAMTTPPSSLIFLLSSTPSAFINPALLSHFSLLLLSQFVHLLGTSAIIPTLSIYGQSISLSSTANGVIIVAPALSLLLLDRLFDCLAA
ncbi:hypothetical protein ACHAXS_003165 [Conticribra weissflogii]